MRLSLVNPVFPKLYDVPYALEYIYSPKQKDVMNLIEQLPNEVLQLYVFGSSLTLNCGEDSDIDILMVAEKSDELYKTVSQIVRGLENEIDLIIKTPEEFKSQVNENNSICSLIMKEGRLMYERPLSTS